MERIDILKGIEQILVQKAYEAGHISHRADGDWQKQADGSWKPYTGQFNQSSSQTQEPTENTEYGEITEEDLEPSYDEDDWDRYDNVTDIIQNTDWESIISEYDNPSVDQIMSDYNLPDDERIRDEISTYIHTDEDNVYGDDEVDYTYAKDIDYNQYDDDIKSIEFRKNDDGEFEPHDDDYFRVADKIYEQTDREDMSDEEADQLYDEIVNRVIDRAYELRNGVQKSAFRDMRSIPITKNMGF